MVPTPVPVELKFTRPPTHNGLVFEDTADGEVFTLIVLVTKQLVGKV